MRVMAGHATLNGSLTLPACNALTMGAMHPVVIDIVMTLGTDDIALVHIDEFAGRGDELVPVLEGVTGATPHDGITMFDLRVMRGLFEVTPVRIWLSIFMAGHAWLVFELVNARGNLKLGRVRVLSMRSR
jgi:hypothetical protein